MTPTKCPKSLISDEQMKVARYQPGSRWRRRRVAAKWAATHRSVLMAYGRCLTRSVRLGSRSATGQNSKE